MHKKILAIIISIFIISACSPKKSKYDAEYIPLPVVNSADEPKYCEPACINLKKLNCPEGQDLVYLGKCSSSSECAEGECIKGKCTETCKMFCEETLKAGRYLGTQCLSKIDNCEDIEKICRKP
jgi:hypothetical protein